MSEAARPVSMEQLADLREKSEKIGAFLSERLAAHLEALQPLLAPRRLLGKHVRGGPREDVTNADPHFSTLRERFAAAAGRPFNTAKELEADPVSIEARLVAHPWQYAHELADGKTIAMTSPVRWLLSYRCGYTPAELRDALATRQNLRSDDARQFVLSAVALALLLEKFPAVTALLADLRYAVSIGPAEGFGELPLVTLQSALPSFRPADDLIASATRLSGVPAFIELIDAEAVASLEDPLREEIARLVGS